VRPRREPGRGIRRGGEDAGAPLRRVHRSGDHRPPAGRAPDIGPIGPQAVGTSPAAGEVLIRLQVPGRRPHAQGRAGASEAWSEVPVQYSQFTVWCHGVPWLDCGPGGSAWWRTTGGRPGRWCFECEKRPPLASRPVSRGGAPGRGVLNSGRTTGRRPGRWCVRVQETSSPGRKVPCQLPPLDPPRSSPPHPHLQLRTAGLPSNPRKPAGNRSDD
jgi:hypothetical protein